MGASSSGKGGANAFVALGSRLLHGAPLATALATWIEPGNYFLRVAGISPSWWITGLAGLVALCVAIGAGSLAHQHQHARVLNTAAIRTIIRTASVLAWLAGTLTAHHLSIAHGVGALWPGLATALTLLVSERVCRCVGGSAAGGRNTAH